MPVQRSYAPFPVRVSDSGKFLPDLPAYRIGPSDYVQKLNFERFDGTERKRAGWDFPEPTDLWTADMLGLFDANAPCEAIEGIRRPNGTYAIVGCGGGKIKYFSYDLNAWVTIGTGYAERGAAGFLWWQIEDVAGYAVFNNGRDLMCTWQVGDGSVTPIYEFRESGYASCGHICEYYGVLICANILEIDPSEMAALMNGGTPYHTIVEGGAIAVIRIGFERVWSNIGAPRDFAATVTGSVSMSSAALTLAWPMASFHVGDIILVQGAGAAGGNLTTAIDAIAGTAVTLHDPAVTAVTNKDVSLATAIDSIVGSDELEGDGSTIIVEKPLKNQLISYKESGEIFQSYYTASLTQPFASQRMSGSASAKRSIRFPRALVNVLDQYHLFPGAQNFYRYELSAQEPVQHEMFLGAEKAAFFNRVAGVGKLDVWAADNTTSGQIIFAFPINGYEEGYEEYTAQRAISFTYQEGQESIDEIDDFHFLCAATVSKPIAGELPDSTELWFLMGSETGRVTRYGRSNTSLYTMRRYGQLFDAVLEGGLLGFGAETIDKDLKRFTLMLSGVSDIGNMIVQLFAARQSNDTPVLICTKILNDPIFPGVINTYFSRAFFKYRFTCALDVPIRIAGQTWLIAGTDIEQVSQI